MSEYLRDTTTVWSPLTILAKAIDGNSKHKANVDERTAMHQADSDLWKLQDMGLNLRAETDKRKTLGYALDDIVKVSQSDDPVFREVGDRAKRMTLFNATPPVRDDLESTMLDSMLQDLAKRSTDIHAPARNIPNALSSSAPVAVQPTPLADTGYAAVGIQPAFQAAYDKLPKGVLEAAAAKNGIHPAVLTALIQHESGGFNPNARSSTDPNGLFAKGLGQFRDGTVPEIEKLLGRKIDPYNPVDAIEGTAAYLRSFVKRGATSYPEMLMAYHYGWAGSRGKPLDQNYINKILVQLPPKQAALGAQ